MRLRSVSFAANSVHTPGPFGFTWHARPWQSPSCRGRAEAGRNSPRVYFKYSGTGVGCPASSKQDTRLCLDAKPIVKRTFEALARSAGYGRTGHTCPISRKPSNSSTHVRLSLKRKRTRAKDPLRKRPTTLVPSLRLFASVRVAISPIGDALCPSHTTILRLGD